MVENGAPQFFTRSWASVIPGRKQAPRFEQHQPGGDFDELATQLGIEIPGRLDIGQKLTGDLKNRQLVDRILVAPNQRARSRSKGPS